MEPVWASEEGKAALRRAVRADPEDFTMGFLGKARVKKGLRGLRKLRELRSSNQLRAAHPRIGVAAGAEARLAQAPGPGGPGRACYHCSIFNPVLRLFLQ